jgi:hypothetical protein
LAKLLALLLLLVSPLLLSSFLLLASQPNINPAVSAFATDSAVADVIAVAVVTVQ